MKYKQNPEHGFEIDARDTMYPTLLRVSREDERVGSRYGTAFGYVVEGKVRVVTKDFEAVIGQHAFFAAPDGADIEFQGEGQVVTIDRLGYRGVSLVGQREKVGRLSYIDGCSDSMLVPPQRLGDPVLNFLHFPDGIKQTQHIHPSIRMGIVVGGRGNAWRQATTTKEGWNIPLQVGGVFQLEEQEIHSFETFSDHMDIIAYHPDTDWGPTDQNHPMLNRTYIDHGKPRADAGAEPTAAR